MNASQLKENISLDSLLQKEGFSPKKIQNENVFWYCSPFREEKEPSFKIDLRTNRWYDFAEGSGGSIIDFIMKFYKKDFKESIIYLNKNYELVNNTKVVLSEGIEYNYSEKLDLTSVKPLYKYYLLDYISKTRKINLDIAKRYCVEVYYKITYPNKIANYVAIGFENIKGGYEIRNAKFKGSINEKNISLIKNNSSKIKIFEGFIDFLSYLTIYPKDEYSYDFLILNSTSFIKQQLDEKNNSFKNGFKKIEDQFLYKLIKPYQFKEYYFDNDTTGNSCKSIMKNVFNDSLDSSYLYKNFNDLNESLK